MASVKWTHDFKMATKNVERAEEDLRIAMVAKQVAMRRMRDEKDADMQIIIKEGVRVGFTRTAEGAREDAMPIFYHLRIGEYTLSHFRCVSSKSHALWTIRNPTRHHVKKEDIERMGLTQEQIEYLCWSTDQDDMVGKYWDGKTEFTCMQEVVEYLKKNAVDIFSVHVKSARKQ